MLKRHSFLCRRECLADFGGAILEFRLLNPVQLHSVSTECGCYDGGQRALALRRLTFRPYDEAVRFFSCDLGRMLSFGWRARDMERFLGDGVSRRNRGCGTEGDNAWLGLAPALLPEKSETLRLRLSGKALVSPINPKVRVDVLVNGQEVAQWVYSGRISWSSRRNFPRDW